MVEGINCQENKVPNSQVGTGQRLANRGSVGPSRVVTIPRTMNNAQAKSVKDAALRAVKDEWAGGVAGASSAGDTEDIR